MVHVLVVGAGGGIGRAFAHALLARGDAVTATVRQPCDARELERELPGVAAHALDLSDGDAALASLHALVERLPTIDAVAVCTGVAPFGPAEVTPLATFRHAFEVNVVGLAAVFQATAAHLRRSRGRLLVVSSMAGRLALPILPAYSASKFALEALCDVIRRETVPHGVRVVVVEPGGVDTPMVAEQAETARNRRDALAPDQAALYAGLFDSFGRMTAGVRAAPSSTPEQVAAVMLEALDAADPLARLVAGPDARQALDAIVGLTDAQVDDLVGQMFPH